MSQPSQEQAVAQALQAAARKAGAPVQKWSPLESIPTLSIGAEGDIKPGMTVAGMFVRTERLVSDKFTNSQEIDPATGKKVQYRHVLKNGDVQYALWTTGELSLAFERLAPNTYVEITYKGKDVVNGRNQHTFDFAVGQQA